MSVPHITVCICTFQRPAMLARLLNGLVQQRTDGRFSWSVAVADNDAAQTARPTVEAWAVTAPVPIVYGGEPVQNFALVRNRALALASGDFVAFIDDDEFPVADWLWRLFVACQDFRADGVLGPVVPHFDQPPPDWLVRGGFYQRARHATGFPLSWSECRTGNVLLRRAVFEGIGQPFREEFATGGEDQDFFHRAAARGRRFIWCDEAIAYEVVPPARWSRRFLLSRAFLRGRNSLRQGSGRRKNIGKSLAAVPLYTLMLPLLLLAGQHRFMRYLVKWGDHTGRLLALLGLNPVQKRRM